MSAKEKKPADQPITVKDFVEHDKVKACLKRLQDTFTEANPLVVSDVLDNQGNQYVHLVQKGGGVLGVALVGYTYILEKMKIRFLRQAGTSAGAINTALMTVIDSKQDAKSEKILDAICNLNFFQLVDGHPVARWLIKKIITHGDFMGRVKKRIVQGLGIFGALLAGDIILTGLQYAIPSLSLWTGICFVLTGIWGLLITVIIIYAGTLLKQLKNAGYGINPGDFFYDWIKLQLKANGVHTVSDLTKKAGADIPGLHLRTEHPQGMEGLTGDVTFIASELVTKNKIQFPAMCHLFRDSAHIDLLQPAGFVRASMSIPVFFESYMINDIPCTHPEVKKAWLDTFNEPDPPSSARFVDGGILSNFPINLFYNPKITTPRLPTFGIDLSSARPADHKKNPFSWSLPGYFGRMFNTVCNYYDKDFLIKNKVFENGIGRIPIDGYNWLNFFLSSEDKVNLFVLGAEAATNFLIRFNWDEYKNRRSEMQEEMNRK